MMTGNETNSKDVNTIGQDGFTPLMLSSIRDVGLETTTSGNSKESSENSTEIIRSLIMQGADIHAQTYITGETSLHLAARYAQTDAANVLLDAGADPNNHDAGGRTPLHTAVASDSRIVFQILLRNPSINLNARAHDGSTPMILAARLAIEGTVKDLIIAGAELNIMDKFGKTALHWSAAVNNAGDTFVLLQHGADRDAQDVKDETPLFLAAKDGCYETAKILLDHNAKSDITDHMDCLPRDIAAKRMYHDILNLLDEYRVLLKLQNELPISEHGLHTFMHSHKIESKVRRNRKIRPYFSDGHEHIVKKIKCKLYKVESPLNVTSSTSGMYSAK